MYPKARPPGALAQMHIRQLFSFRYLGSCCVPYDTATCHVLGKLDRHFDERDRHQGVESSDIVISSATFQVESRDSR